MNYKITKSVAGALGSAMERETISKNRVNFRNVRRKNNFLIYLLSLASVALVVACGQKGGNTETSDSVRIADSIAATNADNTATSAKLAVKEDIKQVVEETKTSKLHYLPSSKEIKTNMRSVFESFSQSGIDITFNWGASNNLVFLMSNNNNFRCKVVILYFMEDGKSGTLTATLKAKERNKEIDPKADINNPISPWAVKEILQID